MPKYLGKEYWQQMICDKMSYMSKALLTVPTCLGKYNFDCCWKLDSKIDDMLPMLQEFPMSECPMNLMLSDCDGHVKLLEIEPFQYFSNPAITFEGVEVIPSSNPESEAEASDILSSIDHLQHIKSASEEFCRQCVSALQPLEEPVCIPNGTGASMLMPPLNQLVSKFEVVVVQDPLRKSDGSSWAENDFFQPLYALDSDDCSNLPMPDDPSAADEFHKVTNATLKEPFMSPLVTKYQPETYKVEMCEPELNQNYNLASENCEEILASVNGKQILECNVDSLNIVEHIDSCDATSEKEDPCFFFLNIKKSGDTPESVAVKNAEGTPLLKLKDVDISDRAQEAIEKSIIHNAIDVLNLVPVEENSDSCTKTFLRGKELKKLELSLWLREKYNDEMQISEPDMGPLELPTSTIQQATDLITLAADTVETKVCHNMTELSSIEIPLLYIEETDAHLESSVPKPVEEFHKNNSIALEFSDWKSEDWECQAPSNHLDNKIDQVSESNDSKEEDWPCQPPNKQSDEKACTHQDEGDLRPSKDFQEIEQNDPLDSFLFMRHKMKLKEPIKSDKRSELEEQQDKHSEQKSKQSLPQGFEIRIQPVPFRGPMEDVLQCLVDCAAPYLDYMIRDQHISREKSLMSITVDTTKFVFKEMEKHIMDHKVLDTTCMENALCLHTLRTAADYLVNASVEACCAYLVSQKERYKDCFKDKLEDVIKKVYHMQGEVLKQNILHPKQEYLWLEINRSYSKCNGCKILVVVPRGLPHLQQSIKTLLCSVPQLSVAVLPDFTTPPIENKWSNMVCITQYVESMPAACLSQFTKVIQYDEELGSFFKAACKKQECSYIGLMTELPDVSSPKGEPEVEGVSTPFTLICSDEISHNKQLLCMLEARHNIFVIERNFSQLRQKGFKHPSADITFSSTHGAVLLSLVELDQHWNMEKVVKRYLALGFQYSFIFIIAHAIGLTTRYPIGKDVVGHIHKLRASLANLSKASDYFNAQYKILVRLTEADVASCIRSLANMYISSQRDTDTERSLLSTDMSQQEEALLQFPSLNPFSAQVLLQKLNCRDILGMSQEEIFQAQPDMEKSTVKFLKHMTSAWSQSVNNRSCNSQASVSTNVTMDTSFASSGHSSASCVLVEELNSQVNEISGKKTVEKIKPLQTTGSLDLPHIVLEDIDEQGPLGASHSTVSEKFQSQRSNYTTAYKRPILTRDREVSNFEEENRSYHRLAQPQLLHSPVQNLMVYSENNTSDCLKTPEYPGDNMSATVSDAQVRQNSSYAKQSDGDRIFDSPYHTIYKDESNFQTYYGQRGNSHIPHQYHQSDDLMLSNLREPHHSERNQFGNSTNEEGFPNLDQLIHQGAENKSEINQNISGNSQVPDFLLRSKFSQYVQKVPNEYHQCRPQADGLGHYETMRSSVNESQRNESSVQYKETSGLSLLKEPHQKSLFSSQSSYCRPTHSKSYLHEPSCAFNVPFHNSADASCYIKQETLTDEDPSCSDIIVYGPNRGAVREKSLTSCSLDKDTRNTYGVFSATARRHESINVSPQYVSTLLEEQSYQQPHVPTEIPTQFRYNGLNNTDMFADKNQPLPFSVSKALKRHLSQIEEQNAYKVPRMFQISHSGEANRADRLTRRFNIDNLHNEKSLKKEAPMSYVFLITEDKGEYVCKGRSSCKTNNDGFSNPNEIRKISANREKYLNSLAHYQCFPPPLDFDVLQCGSNVQLHQTSQSWNVCNSSVQYSNKGMTTNLANIQHETGLECLKPSQFSFKENSRGPAKFYDRHDQPTAGIYVKEEQPSPSVGIFSKGYEQNISDVGQVNNPDKNAHHVHTISNSGSTYAHNKNGSNMSQRIQSPGREGSLFTRHVEMLRRQLPLSHTIYSQSGEKASRNCNSKWHKYDLNTDENHPPCATTNYRVSMNHSGGYYYKPQMGHASRTGRGNRDLSPPMDLPYSPDVQSTRFDAPVRSIPDEDSKLKKWQLYLQQQTLRSQGGEEFNS